MPVVVGGSWRQAPSASASAPLSLSLSTPVTVRRSASAPLPALAHPQPEEAPAGACAAALSAPAACQCHWQSASRALGPSCQPAAPCGHWQWSLAPPAPKSDRPQPPLLVPVTVGDRDHDRDHDSMKAGSARGGPSHGGRCCQCTTLESDLDSSSLRQRSCTLRLGCHSGSQAGLGCHGLRSLNLNGLGPPARPPGGQAGPRSH